MSNVISFATTKPIASTTSGESSDIVKTNDKDLDLATKKFLNFNANTDKEEGAAGSRGSKRKTGSADAAYDAAKNNRASDDDAQFMSDAAQAGEDAYNDAIENGDSLKEAQHAEAVAIADFTDDSDTASSNKKPAGKRDAKDSSDDGVEITPVEKSNTSNPYSWVDENEKTAPTSDSNRDKGNSSKPTSRGTNSKPPPVNASAQAEAAKPKSLSELQDQAATIGEMDGIADGNIVKWTELVAISKGENKNYPMGSDEQLAALALVSSPDAKAKICGANGRFTVDDLNKVSLDPTMNGKDYHNIDENDPYFYYKDGSTTPAFDKARSIAANGSPVDTERVAKLDAAKKANAPSAKPATDSGANPQATTTTTTPPPATTPAKTAAEYAKMDPADARFFAADGSHTPEFNNARAAAVAAKDQGRIGLLDNAKDPKIKANVKESANILLKPVAGRHPERILFGDDGRASYQELQNIADGKPVSVMVNNVETKIYPTAQETAAARCLVQNYLNNGGDKAPAGISALNDMLNGDKEFKDKELQTMSDNFDVAGNQYK